MNNPLLTETSNPGPQPRYEIHWPSVVLAIATMAFITFFNLKGWQLPTELSAILGAALQTFIVHEVYNS